MMTSTWPISFAPMVRARSAVIGCPGREVPSVWTVEGVVVLAALATERGVAVPPPPKARPQIKPTKPPTANAVMRKRRTLSLRISRVVYQTALVNYPATWPRFTPAGLRGTPGLSAGARG